MRPPLTACALALALAWGLSGAADTPAAAHPDTPALIEALMPPAMRGLRNLQVRQRAEGASAVAPSASSASAPAATPAVVAAPVAPAGEPRPSVALAIQFELNSARLRPENGPLLGNLVAAMQSPELKTSRFIIEGHTDASGAAALNQRLSQERADEVRLYLVALGVHPARLRAVGRGASEPANPLAPGAAENRRVRVVTVE